MSAAITTWILSILGIVIIGGIVDLFLPNGKISKYVKTIIATAATLIIVMPIPGLIKTIFLPNSNNIFTSNVELDAKFLEYTKKTKISYLENGCILALKNDGVQGVAIKIEGDIKNNDIIIKTIKINLANLVIENKDEHIDKYKLLENLVCGYLKIDKGLIVFYE